MIYSVLVYNLDDFNFNNYCIDDYYLFGNWDKINVIIFF